VILALPPKLWAKNIAFEPSLPPNLMNTARETHTWMEDSIKIAVTYKTDFWEQENKSGTFFSNAGPVTELYDHCNQERSTFALCGFISTSFKKRSDEERKAIVIQQLKTVFGEKATQFLEYNECIWSREKHTFQYSETLLLPHQNNGNPIFNKTFWENKLLISSAEAASESPGYMDGAVFVGNQTAIKIIQLQQY
jgi:monoamine oxidase